MDVVIHRRKKIGQAMWLFALFAENTPVGWRGDRVYVAEGALVSDQLLQERLCISKRTLNDWRGRLRRLGLLDWTIKLGSGCRVYQIGEVTAQPGVQEPTKDPGVDPLAEDGKKVVSALVH
jgi:hypothetical protein